MSDEQTLRESQEKVRDSYMEALKELGVKQNDKLLNRLDNIIAAYDGDEPNKSDQTRFYHDVTHVSDLLAQVLPEGIKDKQDALAALAIVNHDVIYAHMDRGIDDSIKNTLTENYIKEIEGDGKIFLNSLEKIPEDKKQHYEAVLNIFDVSEEQRNGTKELSPIANPQNGHARGFQNELLSALLLVDDLAEAGVPMKDRLVVIADIASTEPFQGADHLTKIYQAVEQENIKLENQLTSKELEKSAKYMVDIANADVKSFTKDNFAETFKDSQNLMLESIVGKNNANPEIAQDFLAGAGGTSFFMNLLLGNIDGEKRLILHGAEIAGVVNYSSGLDLEKENAQAIENIKAIKLAVDSQIAATKLVVELNGDDKSINIKEAMKNIPIPASEGKEDLNATEVKALSGIDGKAGKESPFPQTALAAYLLKEGGQELITAINGAEKSQIKDLLTSKNINVEKSGITTDVAEIVVDSSNKARVAEVQR